MTDDSTHHIYLVGYQVLPALGAKWQAAEWFRCNADDTAHAAAQCRNAYPGCRIVQIYNMD